MELASLLASLLSLLAKCSILSSAALRTSVYIAGPGHSRLRSKRGGLDVQFLLGNKFHCFTSHPQGPDDLHKVGFYLSHFGFLVLEENHSSKNFS